MAEHTPIPWKATKPFGMGGMYHSFVEGRNGKIARVDSYVRPIRDGAPADTDGSLCKADADFIVKAVNHHEELVEALRYIAQDRSGWLTKARTVIAKIDKGASGG